MPRPGKCGWLVAAYAAICLLALALIPLSATGIITPDPLAGVFAVMLSMPWLFVFERFLGHGGIAWGLVVVAVGMALNAFILHQVCRWLGRLLRS